MGPTTIRLVSLRGKFGHRQRRRMPCEKEAEIGVLHLQAPNAWVHQKLEETMKDRHLEDSEGTHHPCQHRDFKLLALRTVKKIHFCCFKVPSLWYFLLQA